MHMAYSKNPHLPGVRMDAVRLVRSGWSTRKVARHLGFSQAAIVQWMKRAPADLRARVIPTKSSRPWHHPRELDPELVRIVIAYRHRYRRGAEVLRELLRRDGIAVSLSSVKRTLQRNELTRFSRWKKWHQYPPRPLPEAPGILVETDTIHDGPHDARLVAPFVFKTLHSDHGPEFSKWFTKRILERGMAHRHSRVRQPNDNAHLERFNRTIQEECIIRLPRKIVVWRKEIPEYLRWYNEERPHLGLAMKTPAEKIAGLITSY